ncbi:MAG TPA: 2Fe-2S iron-sulfur cluster-binding protein [Lautropia sp.]|jgi:2Fe-2S ferredoxin|nr:2Fe-2S iron-sulfur cluster-binding protein [Lautropia sp.]
MPAFTLISPDGQSLTLQGRDGDSVMQTAVEQGARGIVGECGGSAMCATCHVYVDAAWRDKLAPILATEAEMLECTSSERRPESRLSCQIKLSSALDGLVLRLPETQQ